MLLCISSNSKYDSVMRHDTNKSFTSEELEGYDVFRQKCSSCHAEPLFTDHSFRNNGLTVSDAHDPGRYLITQAESDKYRFKVPSLRNLEYTAPYMHDGRFANLEEVLDFYSNNIRLESPNLDINIKAHNKQLELSDTQKAQIIEFLKTLSDTEFVNDPKFKSPF